MAFQVQIQKAKTVQFQQDLILQYVIINRNIVQILMGYPIVLRI